MLFLIIQGAESLSIKGLFFTAGFVGVLAVICNNQLTVTHRAHNIH